MVEETAASNFTLDGDGNTNNNFENDVANFAPGPGLPAGGGTDRTGDGGGGVPGPVIAGVDSNGGNGNGFVTMKASVLTVLGCLLMLLVIH